MRISSEGHLVTVINVFETEPEQQQELINQWIRFVQEEVKNEPGLIGAALHKSTDGTRVINYAQWRSEEEYANFVKKSIKPIAPSLASRVDPHLYEVVYLTERAES